MGQSPSGMHLRWRWSSPNQREEAVQLVLASGSPGRRGVLAQLELPCVVDVPTVEERVPSGKSPDELVQYLADLKANDVASRRDSGLVLAADTEIVVDGEIFGKPSDEESAFRMLSRLSGRRHDVVTAMTGIVLPNRTRASLVAKTTVSFRDLSESEIVAYVASGEPFGKAGAYAVQGKGALLVSELQGEYANLMGFPIACFLRLLDQLNIEVIIST